MGRAILTIILPLFLPTALYIGWRLALGRGVNLPAAWVWLTAAGLILAALTLVLVSFDFGEPRDGVYVPPHLSDGKIVPGHVVPAGER
jgi:Family of unknown function (DUF6111)